MPANPTPTRDYNMAMGNPDGAKASASSSNAYLIIRPTYSLSYNQSTGFDRGHLCPSDDRDSTADENKTTFILTNVVPQAPQLNRQSWLRLEDNCRSLVAQGNELYIIAGTYGKGGEGDNGRQRTLLMAN